MRNWRSSATAPRERSEEIHPMSQPSLERELSGVFGAITLRLSYVIRALQKRKGPTPQTVSDEFARPSEVELHARSYANQKAHAVRGETKGPEKAE
jgi:hypothetical protein